MDQIQTPNAPDVSNNPTFGTVFEGYAWQNGWEQGYRALQDSVLEFCLDLEKTEAMMGKFFAQELRNRFLNQKQE